jgi:hypothetical protein
VGCDATRSRAAVRGMAELVLDLAKCCPALAAIGGAAHG